MEGARGGKMTVCGEEKDACGGRSKHVEVKDINTTSTKRREKEDERKSLLEFNDGEIKE